jgi:hypothetical protein
VKFFEYEEGFYFWKIEHMPPHKTLVVLNMKKFSTRTNRWENIVIPIQLSLLLFYYHLNTPG